MALLLSMGASLLIRSFDSLMHVDLGFRPDNVLAFSVPLFHDPVRRGAHPFCRTGSGEGPSHAGGSKRGTL